MDRMILHSDINACYASIELLRHPELRGRPVAVGGERELRHGIILAKDQMARAAGVRTGMTLWAARQQCPELTILPPDFELYYDYSRRVREIYAGFTDRCEPFGMDECWLDMTGCVGREDALRTAQEVRQRVLDATGLTVSVGVSWCKAIAKLGSDYRKPNAVTVIDRARFADMVWPLPVSSLLFAGRSSVRQLERLGIRTVGALAAADADVLEQPVHRIADLPPPKSIGNSATAPRDLICEADARAALLSLAESVGARLRLEGYQCRTVELSVRTADLHWRSHRMALRHPSDLTSELLDAALTLCEQAHLWPDPLRSISCPRARRTSSTCSRMRSTARASGSSILRSITSARATARPVSCAAAPALTRRSASSSARSTPFCANESTHRPETVRADFYGFRSPASCRR